MPLRTITLALVVLKFADGFNFDVQNAQVFENPASGLRDSYFGYSVAIYSAGGSSVLLVGAPRANSSRPADGVVESGAVYRCHLDRSNADDGCAEWVIDGSTDNMIFGKSSVRQKKDNAWLGGSISVQNSTSNPRVVVCAPGWKKNILSMYNNEKWFMIGMCFSTVVNDSAVFDRTESARRLIPFIVSPDTVQIDQYWHYYYGMGQAGFSAHLTPDRGDLVLGAPGVLHWTGSTIVINDTLLRRPYHETTVIPNILIDHNFEFNDYFGYSVTSGYYFDIGKRTYAAGAPRSANTLGRVFVFDFPQVKKGKLLLKTILYGELLGEYFGSSLASCDINADGRDDLIVGAPQWSTYLDEGRVYAFISKGHFKFDRQPVDGKAEGGRFGTSVVCLGDIDYDGFADIAVGAPYEDELRGAVYIYTGSTSGLRYSQRIGAREFEPELRGFGFSISEPRDVDGNGYGDLAVGAYLSGHAVLVKAKPAIKLEIKLMRSSDSPLLTENATRFSIQACSSYDGAFAPESYRVIKEFEIDKVHNRGLVYQDGKLYGKIYKVSVVLKKGELKCVPVRVNLKKNIQNVIDPIEIDGQIYTNEKPSCEKCPAVNPQTSKVRDTLKLSYILNDCGRDNVCVSDLRVDATSDLGVDHKYIIGSRTRVNFTVNVENTLEPAYKTQVHIYMPRPIVLARVPIECEVFTNKTLEVASCDIGNPLRYNRSITFQLDLSAAGFSDKYLDLVVNATTQSQEKSLSDNVASYRINFDTDADLAVIGESHEHVYSYFKKEIVEGRVKKFSLNHIYDVWKLGVTPIDEATLLINIPILFKNRLVSKINRVVGSKDGQKYNCQEMKDAESLPRGSFDSLTAININSTNPEVAYRQVRCDLGSFVEDQSVATIVVSLDFHLSNATGELIEEEKNIFYITEGYVKITNVTTNITKDQSHYSVIATKIYVRSDPKVSVWIFVFSLVLGLLLFSFITWIFDKIGFFNRENNEELAALNSSEMVGHDSYHHESSGISETEIMDDE